MDSPDILLRVGGALPRKDLACARSVCSKWRDSMAAPPPYHEILATVHDPPGHDWAQFTTWSSDGELVAALFDSHVHVYNTQDKAGAPQRQLAYRVKMYDQVRVPADETLERTFPDFTAMSFRPSRLGAMDLVVLANPPSARYAPRLLTYGPDGAEISSTPLFTEEGTEEGIEGMPHQMHVRSAFFARDAATLAVLYVTSSDDDQRLGVINFDRSAGHRVLRMRTLATGLGVKGGGYSDLPAVDGTDDVALSPDGTKVAALTMTRRPTRWKRWRMMVYDGDVARTVYEHVESTGNTNFELVAWDATSRMLSFVEYKCQRVFVCDVVRGGTRCLSYSDNLTRCIHSCAWSLDRLVISHVDRVVEDGKSEYRDSPLLVLDSRTGETVQSVSVHSLTPHLRGCFLRRLVVAPDGRAVLGIVDAYDFPPDDDERFALRLINL